MDKSNATNAKYSFDDGSPSSSLTNFNQNVDGIISFLDSPNTSSVSNKDDLPTTQPITILKDVTAYVEVRAEYENRSRAVEKQLQHLGAKISAKLTPEVTHVIFKGGRKATIKKAQKLGVHLVSVLWVESCKRNEDHMPEGSFQALLPENRGTPNLAFGRLKKTKSMQPKDFDEEIANSADRAKRKRQRKANAERWKLFDVGSSSDEASPVMIKPNERRFFVAETQPRTPEEVNTTDGSITIPDTPSSMKETLNRMQSFRKKIEDPNYSPHSSSDEDILQRLRAGPQLQRKLFDAPNDVSLSTPQACTSIEMAPGTEPPELTDSINAPVTASECDRTFDFNAEIIDPPPKSGYSKLKSRQVFNQEQAAIDKKDSGNTKAKPSPRRRSGRLSIKLHVPEETSQPSRENQVDLRLIAIKQDIQRKKAVNSPKETRTPGHRRSSLKPCLPTVEEQETVTEDADGPQKRNADTGSGGGLKRQTSKGKHKLLAKDAQPPPALLVPTKSSNAAQEKPRVYSPVVKRKRGRPVSEKSTDSDISGDKPAAKQRRRSERVTPAVEQNEQNSSLLNVDTGGSVGTPKTKQDNRKSMGGSNAKVNKSASTRRQSMSININARAADADMPIPPARKPEIDTQDMFSDTSSVKANTSASKRRRSVPVGNWLSDEKWGLSPEADKTKKSVRTKETTFLEADEILCSQSTTSEGHSTAYSMLHLPSTATSTSLILPNQTRSRRSSFEFQTAKTMAKKSSVPEASTSGIQKSRTRVKPKLTSASVLQAKQNRCKVKGKENRSSTSSSDGDSVTSTNSNSSDRRKWKNIDISPNVCFKDGHVTRTIVTTSLHSDEQDTARAVVLKLGGYEFANDVSSTTSHLVCGGNRRTLNVLRSLVRGCWIVSFEWVLRSLEAGKWLSEESFERHEYFPSTKAYRHARFSSDGAYKPQLFANEGIFFVNEKSCPPRNEMMSLISLCGGTTTSCARKAVIYVGRQSKNTNLTCVNEQWILDCISSNKILPKNKYLIRTFCP